MTTDAFQILNHVARVEKHLRKCSTECLCPSCKKPAIRSHAVQKNGWLSNIAENNHVMGVQRQIAAPLFKSSPESPPEPKIVRIGLNDASTFWGYCNVHDTQLFDCIERHCLCKGDINQVKAFHLRAMSFERVAKQSQQEIFRCLAASHGNVLYRESMKSEVNIQEQMFEADSRYRWDLFWSDNKDAHFINEYSFRWIVIPKNIGVASVTMISPMAAIMEDRYMTAHRRQDGSYDVGRPSFSLSVIPDGQETHVVMCWHNADTDFVAQWEHDLCTSSGTALATFLNKCIFVKSEDFYMRPSLWESLDGHMRDLVRENLCPSFSDREIPNVITI